MHIIDHRVDVTALGKEIASRTRRLLDGRNVVAVNIMGAIGSGKTILIEKMVERIGETVALAAVAGDVVSDLDAGRIRRTGIPVVGVNTGRECHLDAHMIEHAIADLAASRIDLLLVENVGNLVCPADFDLGTHKRVVVVSVSEGDDIVAKHPMIFLDADLCIVNKVDIAHAVGADPRKMADDARRINPRIEVMLASLRTGQGVSEVMSWFERLVASRRGQCTEQEMQGS